MRRRSIACVRACMRAGGRGAGGHTPAIVIQEAEGAGGTQHVVHEEGGDLAPQVVRQRVEHLLLVHLCARGLPDGAVACLPLELAGATDSQCNS